jgi:hypothetical protein
MGIGSPRLRTAVTLPLLAAAALIVAPTAYAGGELALANPAPVAATVPDAAAVAADVTTAVQQAVVPAADAVSTTATDVQTSAAQSVASTTAGARDTVEPVLSTATHVVAPAPAVTPSRPSTTEIAPRRVQPRTIAPKPHSRPVTPRPQTHAHRAPAVGTPDAPRPGLTISRSGGVHEPQLRGTKSYGLTPPWPGTRRGTDLSVGGAVNGGLSGVGVLLLAVAAAAAWWLLAAHGARVRLVLHALRPIVLVLQLERPD